MYYMLIGSLPALPPHFERAEQVPISKLRLQERLRMLEPEDALTVEKLTDFLVWDRHPLDYGDEEILHRYHQFMEEESHEFLRRLMDYAMTVRIMVAAMRRRRMDLDPPELLGRWHHTIVENWKRPDFGLGALLPWLGEVQACFDQDRPEELDQILLNVAWTWIRSEAGRYDFASFEAVILYLFRWEIVYRWTSRDAEAGLDRFETLVASAMAEYENMF